MKELLEISRKMVGHLSNAKFEVTGTQLMTIAMDLQKFSQLIVSEEKKLSDTFQIKEEKNVMQKEKTSKEKIVEAK